jgi:hypothetical protein
MAAVWDGKQQAQLWVQATLGMGNPLEEGYLVSVLAH